MRLVKSNLRLKNYLSCQQLSKGQKGKISASL